MIIYKRIIISAAFLILISIGQLSASEGRLYEIAEQDAIEEIKAKAATVDWKKHFNREEKEKRLKEFKPPNLLKLPEARKDNTYYVDMTYTLDIDIPDGKGGILYPKGYRFNPLDYMNYNGTIVVINGNKKNHIEWFKKSGLTENIRVKLLITDGNYYTIAQTLKRPVFYALKEIVERFQLKHIPCVVSQYNKTMQVKEYALEEI